MQKVSEAIGEVEDIILQAEFPSDEVIAQRKADFEEQELQRRIANEWANYEQKCPPLMKDTDVARLPTAFDKANKRVLGRGEGIVIHGVTGTGKTRAMWQLLQGLSMQGRNWQCYSARKLADFLGEAFLRKRHEAELHALCVVPWLAIDDLGKERMTDRWESDLFDLINERTERKKPTIITTNFDGERLEERFRDKELGKALLRRVREFFPSVAFRES